jgi:UTP--glucose-1-phosphate uridylyltransferase
MNKIRKCVIPAAGMWTRFLPATKALPKEMFPIIDKPVMQLLVEEAISAWCTDIIIVTWRSKRAIEDHFDSNFELEEKLDKSWKFDYLKVVKWLNNMANIVYVRQPYPKWDWDALLRTKNLIWNEPFLVLNGDELIYNKEKSAWKQLVDSYMSIKSTVIWTATVSDDTMSSYWILETSNIKDNIFKVQNFLEKPKPQETTSRISSIWKYVLTPDFFSFLERVSSRNTVWEIRVTDAFELMLKEKKDICSVAIKWERYDTWSKIGFLKATIAYALRHSEVKDEFKDFIKKLNIK